MYPHQDYIPPAPIKKSNNLKYGLVVLFAILTTNTVVGSLAFLYGRNLSSKVAEDTPTQTNVLAKEDISDYIPTQDITPTPIASSSSTLTKERSAILTVENPLSGNVESSSASANIRKDILVGEINNGFARGFMTFDITKIPSKAKVKSAILKFDITSEKLPTQYGRLYVDHITYGTSLDSSDYAISAIVSNLSQIVVNKDKAEADITKSVSNDVDNARGKSQIRIHYEIEKKFSNSSSSYLVIPKRSVYLEVKYY